MSEDDGEQEEKVEEPIEEELKPIEKVEEKPKSAVYQSSKGWGDASDHIEWSNNLYGNMCQ